MLSSISLGPIPSPAIPAPPVLARRGYGPEPRPVVDRAAVPCPHRCARWARAEGLGLGDTVALMMRDGAEAQALQLGLGWTGIRVVRLDAQARAAVLAATLAASEALVVIADAAMAGAYAALMGRLAAYPIVWWTGPGADFARLDHALAEMDEPA